MGEKFWYFCQNIYPWLLELLPLWKLGVGKDNKVCGTWGLLLLLFTSSMTFKKRVLDTNSLFTYGIFYVNTHGHCMPWCLLSSQQTTFDLFATKYIMLHEFSKLLKVEKCQISFQLFGSCSVLVKMWLTRIVLMSGMYLCIRPWTAFEHWRFFFASILYLARMSVSNQLMRLQARRSVSNTWLRCWAPDLQSSQLIVLSPRLVGDMMLTKAPNSNSNVLYTNTYHSWVQF